MTLKLLRKSSMLISAALFIGVAGCGSSGGPGTTTGSGGNGPSGSGGSGGAGPSGSGGAGPSGSGGSTSSGSGGSDVDASGGGSGGSTGTDGAAGATEAGTGSGGTIVPVGTKGVQADPGTEGDGTIDDPPPYPPAPETVARKAGVPVGKVMPYQIYASTNVYKSQGLKFNYTIYVPAQYQKGKPAAFMLFLDGQHFAGPGTPVVAEDYHWNAPILYDNLIASGELPVTIVAFMDPGVPNGMYRRGDNFHPDAELRSMEYDKASADFGNFLINEFIPDCVKKDYDIVDDPDGWGIGGHSSGGIAAITTPWFHIDKFHKAHSSSASYPNTNNFPGTPSFPNAFNSVTPAKPIRITMLSGTMDLGGWFAANTNAANILKAKGYHYRFRPGQDNHVPPLAAINEFANAMRWLWRGYSLPWYK
jgi:enterochelin esterase family protein